MKKTLPYLILILFGFTARAQQAPHLAPLQTYWQSFGFQKQVDHVKIAYYKSDSLGYEPKMAEVISFNKDGHLIQKYIRIFGKYASETAHNYIYTNGVLDSINTYASTSNFNSRQKLHYDNNGQLTHIIATGKFTNYTDTYTYDKSGMVATIERKHQSGSSIKAHFNHKNNYVHEKETSLDGKVTESYYIYDGDELFASFTLSDRPLVTFYNAYHRSDFETEVNKNALDYTIKWRKIKQSDPKAFTRQMGDLQEKVTSRVIFDIPAEARNEDGDWIKRLQIDRRFSKGERRLVYKKLVYADGTISGDTEVDLIFERKVSHIK